MAAPMRNGSGHEASTERMCPAACDCKKHVMSFANDLAETTEMIKAEDWESVRSSTSDSDVFDRTAFWIYTRALFELLHKEATKVTLAYSGEGKPKCSDSYKMIEELRQCLLALVSTVYKIQRASRLLGLLVVKRWHSLILRTILALDPYTQSILAGDEDRLRRETGAVWEWCLSARSAATDSKQCLLCFLADTQSLVTDALDELNEAKDSSSSVAEDDNDDVPSAYDLSVLDAGTGLVKTAKILLRKITSACGTNGKCDTQSQTADYDVIADLVSDSSERVDDFSASLYPPISRQEVMENLPPLAEHLESLLLKFRETHLCAESDLQWIAVIENAVTHNKSKVEQLLT